MMQSECIVVMYSTNDNYILLMYMHAVSLAVTLLWTAGIKFVNFSDMRMLTMLKVSGVNTLLFYNGFKGNMTHLQTLQI